MRILAMALAAGALAACASSGVKVSQAQIDKLVKGETTISQAIGLLGKPTSRATSDDKTTIGYSYTAVSSRPENFIPIVGAFVGGMDMKMSGITLAFDAGGVLRDVTTFENENGIGTNLSSTATGNRVNQPREAK